MAHYVEQITIDLGTFGEWKDVSNLDISHDQKCFILKIFDNITFVLRDEEDRIIWCAAKSGRYSARLGY